MATPKVRDIIRRAMLLIGAIAVGETPSDDEAQDGLQTLNDMLDSWALERLMVYTITRTVFALVPGQQMHSLGLTGNFNIARPPKIERAGLVIAGNETPIDIVDFAGWSRISAKATAGVPTAVWDDAEYPLRRLWFYPVPQAGQSVALYTWNPISKFASINDDAVFPPGYWRAIRYCLAVELAGEYEREVPGAVLAIAVAARSTIKSSNLPKPIMDLDPALGGARPFNILTG